VPKAFHLIELHKKPVIAMDRDDRQSLAISEITYLLNGTYEEFLLQCLHPSAVCPPHD
jgi:hypothetical protein